MKTLDLTKQQFMELKNSFDWIDTNRFATVEMLPPDLAKMWMDPDFDGNLDTPASKDLQGIVFLYGLYKTNSLLKDGEGKFHPPELESFYGRFQVKVYLAYLNSQGKLPPGYQLDKIPLFLFHRIGDGNTLKKWNRRVQTLIDLGMRNISL